MSSFKNPLEIGKPQMFLTKNESFGARDIPDTSNSISNGVKIISKVLGSTCPIAIILDKI